MFEFKRGELRHKAAPVTIDKVTEGHLEGYASTFGNVDRGGDRCMKGCYADTLRDMRKSGRFPWMLYGHATDQIVGEFEAMEEDEKGLRVAGQLWLNDPPRPELAKMIVRAIQSKAGPMGLSIGYRTKEWTYDDQGVRNLLKVELLEVSIVPIPMNAEATVERFKSLEEPAATGIRTIEGALRELGFTRAEAEHIATHGFKNFLATKAARDERGGSDAGDRTLPREEAKQAAIIAALRRNIDSMRI